LMLLLDSFVVAVKCVVVRREVDSRIDGQECLLLV
jgi:hypothetical protein